MKQILFNTEMVKAILDGRKTCTRRVVKPQPKARLAYVCMGYKYGTWAYPGPEACKDWGESYRVPEGFPEDEMERRWNPPCHTGNILYVRETWNRVKLASESEWHYEYRASCENPAYFSNGFFAEWRPSIHMPKEAARLFLRVTEVRVERLQDISKDPPGPKNQVVREGFHYQSDFIATWQNTMPRKDWPIYGWDANPYVWVIEFERCEKPQEAHTIVCAATGQPCAMCQPGPCEHRKEANNV